VRWRRIYCACWLPEYSRFVADFIDAMSAAVKKRVREGQVGLTNATGLGAEQMRINVLQFRPVGLI
jgi:hypothetical protein